MEVDLRGMTFDEAMPEVDKYLDDVYLAGLKEVRLIHGKGTGALRAKIGRFLKGHPRVRAHRLGAWNEGDTGVTVVTIAE
jgi:DNA mismatch repair protein MutS2